MSHSRAKEVSESYKGSEIDFDNTTSAAVAKQFQSTNVQDAVVEAKAIQSDQTTVGISRNATDTEVASASPEFVYVKPDQLHKHLVDYITSDVIPLIPAATTLPVVTYGGKGTQAAMIATYGNLPVGSFVVFDEYYTYTVGWGNGSSTVGAYRRRTITKPNNLHWTFIM